MRLEIRQTKSDATCMGTSSHCTTYQHHPRWQILANQGRQIPRGETALFVNYGYRGRDFCVCHKHAMLFIEAMFDNIKDAHKQAKKIRMEKQ